MNKKSLIVIVPAAILLIVLGGVFFAVKQAAAPEKVVETLKEAIAKDDPAILQDVIVTDNKQAAVNKASIQAMIAYLKENSSSYDVIKAGLEEQIKENDYATTTQQITLTEDGKKWGMFPNYKLRVKTAAIKVTGQSEADRISLAVNESGKPFKKQKDGQYGPVLPGKYNLEVKVTNELGTFLKEEEKDVWGSPEVSLVIDGNALASSDKGVQKEIMKAMDTFNRDIAVYQTSGFNKSKLTNVTDTILEGSFLLEESFETVKDYIDEIHAQYAGAVINLDDLAIHYFDGRWTADVTALVAYNNKVKYRDIKEFKDNSFRSVSTYSFFYDKKQKRWLIDDVKHRDPVGSEEEYWENKREMKVKNPPVLKWKREGGGIKL
ncbi:hypothetical protein F9802_16320 [Bacillus aerolatus]|uniref:Uncharacterized protein n=1 Tax=Bacillus aerolatus TaxID=2653354 RepID=A0A6I1FRT1_9BACI|nr:hypothetical protein [Bacillus aerolatus]KAB7704736.1 hypothetical protein F9802_16320 [Bacillus aerolatus]